MVYRIFAFIMAFMFVAIGGYYLFQERDVLSVITQNKKETSDLLNEQIRLTAEDGSTVNTTSTSTPTDESIAGEVLAGNYSSEHGIEVIIKRNKKAVFVVPASPIQKGDWQIISNNILSITVTINGKPTRYLFSIEDPEREIVGIQPGETTIYTRK